MNKLTKTSIVVGIAVLGLILLNSRHHQSRMQVAQTQGQSWTPTGSVSGTTQSVPTVNLNSNAASAVAAQAGATQVAQADLNFPGARDMQNIVAVARQASLDEAYTSFQIFADGIMKEGASNPAHIQTLLRATLDLSDFDGSNDHYTWLYPVWKTYPGQVKAVLNSKNFSKAQRNEILSTLRDYARALAGKNK